MDLSSGRHVTMFREQCPQLPAPRSQEPQFPHLYSGYTVPNPHSDPTRYTCGLAILPSRLCEVVPEGRGPLPSELTAQSRTHCVAPRASGRFLLSWGSGHERPGSRDLCPALWAINPTGLPRKVQPRAVPTHWSTREARTSQKRPAACGVRENRCAPACMGQGLGDTDLDLQGLPWPRGHGDSTTL